MFLEGTTMVRVEVKEEEQDCCGNSACGEIYPKAPGEKTRCEMQANRDEDLRTYHLQDTWSVNAFFTCMSVLANLKV